MVSMTYGSLAMSQPWTTGAILDFEIQLVSLDIFVPMALRNFHAKGDICISQKALNMSTSAYCVV